MAKYYQGINGAFHGKVGNVVGYMWKHSQCMRAYSEKVHYPNTESQQRERDWFVSMVRFAAQARPALLLGFKHKAFETNMTEGNYFVTNNKRYFHHVDGGIEIDYDKLSVAEGPAADVVFHTPVFREHETLSVEFDRNTLFSRASGDDMVYLYIYSVDHCKGFLAAPIARKTKNINLQLPYDWAGSLVHIYGFVVDREGRSSNSTYIGAGMVNHYNDGTTYIPLNKSWMDFVEVANKVNSNDNPKALDKDNVDGTSNEAAVITPSEAPPE
ncbi:MAG: hypothetical protein IKR33_02055 [Bacteroidales bacterium]|nr:hypothetical protein [Bacteroidales bacterium]